MDKRMSDVNLNQGLLRGIRKMFVFSLVSGVISICLPQYLEIPQLAVILPLVCMVIYTKVGYSHSVDTSFVEQFADSVYYLGFLLTLVALVVSLYFYQGDTLESGLLVSNFSLALLTTIFGLAVRIFINNFQIDIHGAERHIMSGVEQAANELVQKAKLISMQLDVSQQETQIAIKRSIEQAAEGMYKSNLIVDKYARTSSEMLHKSIHAISQTSLNASKLLEKNLLDIKLPDEIFVEQLNVPLTLLANRLSESNILFKELNAQQTVVAERVNDITRAMGKTVAEVDILAHSINLFNDKLNVNIEINDNFVKVVKEISELSKNTAKISENLEQQSEKSGLVLENFVKLADATTTLPAEMEAMSDKLVTASAQVTATFQAIGDSTQSGEKIADDLQGISSALANTRETVKEISDFGVHVISSIKRLETFNQIIEKHTLLLENMAEIAQTDIDLAKQHKNEMADILHQSRKSLLLMKQGIAESMPDNNVNQEKD